MSDLSPSLEDVRERFMTNLKSGGIEACRAMVNDLAVEAGMAEAMADGADDVQHETIMAQDDMTTQELIDRVQMTNGVSAEAATAISRHSLALFLLQLLEEMERNKP